MHKLEVLESIKKALLVDDTLKLKDLSNQTIHSASIQQDTGSIALAVLIYSLSKILEKKSKINLKNWNLFVKKFNSFIDLAIKSLEEEDQKRYEDYLERSRKLLTSLSIDLKNYIQDVFRKASINKASKIYEHGISLGKTAKLLGVSQWELSEYAAQTKVSGIDYNRTLDTKKRAKVALEFFS